MFQKAIKWLDAAAEKRMKEERRKLRDEARRSIPIFRANTMFGLSVDNYLNGQITLVRKDWAWFKPFLDQGIVYDVEIENHRTNGILTHKDVKYKILRSDVDLFRERMREYGWK